MAALTAGKIAVVLFEKAFETFESQQMLLDKVDFWVPSGSEMQNSANYVWRNVQQHAPVITGFDLTGQETGIIEQTYPALLGTPANDFVSQRIDDLRDIGFWERRGIASGMKQASNVNSAIASAMRTQGSLHVRSNTSSGFTFVATAQAVMNERQMPKGQRYFILNDRDTLTYAQDLAGRQTLQGRPEETWKTGQIGRNVAEFDVYTGSFLPTIAGGASPNTTVTGTQSFAPTAGSVDASTGVVTNADYRTATIPVAASASYNVGDKIRFQLPSGSSVLAVGLDDKSSTLQPMTFTIVAKPDGTHITVYPRPIAIDDSGLTALEQAYGNINTQILNASLVVRLNTDTLARTNLFWNKDAVEVMGGTIPAELFKEFAGKKVIYDTMKNGQTMYMIYDADMATLQMRFRLFTWNGITVKDPAQVGVATRWVTT